jgi:hypothetical protein
MRIAVYQLFSCLFCGPAERRQVPFLRSSATLAAAEPG